MENNLKKIRVSKKIKQEKVAKDLDTQQSAISNYEIGKVFPSISMLIKLADYYNTTIDYLLCNTNYNLPIDKIKTDNISNNDLILLNKINKLSNTNKDKVEKYIHTLQDI